MSKKVILTGLRANHDLHIGHVFGAMRPIIDLAVEKSDEFQINMFIPDLHSFTTPIDHNKLQAQIVHNLRLFVAAGLPLNNDAVHIYRQSYVPAHSELTVILNSFAGMGELSRMTQFKDKSAKLTADRVSVGLFDYPVLMAADILLYGASYVPVGDDQSQHIEFTRDIAGRMNAKFGELFVVPKSVKEQHAFFNKEQGLRVRDLQDPTKKMSKSDDTGKGVIFLGDTLETAKKKVLAATTDSLGKIQRDYNKQPGITNLLDIYEQLGGDSAEFINQEQYGPFKVAVADKVTTFLQTFQQHLSEVDDALLQAKLEAGETLMREHANLTLQRVQKAVGLR
jgi:tryptophanyl-tRNA synthetase